MPTKNSAENVPDISVTVRTTMAPKKVPSTENSMLIIYFSRTYNLRVSGITMAYFKKPDRSSMEKVVTSMQQNMMLEVMRYP